jgi:hypothetical protein
MSSDVDVVNRAFAAHGLNVPTEEVAAIARSVPGLRALVTAMRRMPEWTAEHPSEASRSR